MTLDPTIREQTYPYFLQEVPELLQALEQGLLNLRENYTLNQVNTLMRVTHTLKGAAASVGLETITIIAHSLEDIFNALCRPNIALDSATETLLFEGFECLRHPLVAELTGRSINDAEALDHAATVFAQLQEKLGDCFGQDAYMPSSAELGFDITQSIFEAGVTQRLDQLTDAIASAEPEAIATLLRTQSEMFLGLAESLNLSGLKAIAETTIAALDNHPEQAVAIAERALADFRAGHAAVLAGDRSQGGHPCEALQQLALEPSELWLEEEPSQLKDFELDSNAAQGQNDSSLLESIWGETLAADDLASDLVSDLPSDTALVTTALDADDPEPLNPQPLTLDYTVAPAPSTAAASKSSTAPLPTVRVNVEQLERLSNSVGELLTNQNHQVLHIEQLEASVQFLMTRLQQQQQLFTTVQAQLKRQAIASDHASKQSSKRSSKKPTGKTKTQPAGSKGSQLLIQPLLDNAVQLAEAADAIQLFTQQTAQTLQTQQRLLTSTRDALVDARMLPLGKIFDRFPKILHQLETRHQKQVALSLQGVDVLVDKVVAEKLYEPLLHLVRNAFDHGIEPKALRQQRGKAAKGQIEICAYHQGRYLVIEVRDDGEGIDFERIRQRAADQQLMPLDQIDRLNHEQLTALLFEPGFSTSAQISNLSGRGVGLDIVRNQLQNLNGAIAVRSTFSQGTTFTFKIPLNLTIAKLFVCTVSNTTYGLFADTIEHIVIPQPDHITEQYGIKVLRWQQGSILQQVPLYSLMEVVKYGSSLHALLPHTAVKENAPKRVILVRYQGSLLGLEVDQIVGEQELVIRPLVTTIGSPQYVYGACTLVNDQLTLVIDPIVLIQQILAQQTGTENRSAPALLSSRPQPSLPAAQQSAQLPASADLATPSSNQKILIAEDSITARQRLVLTLKKAGYRVHQAKDGQDAIAQLQQQSDIQLIISDLDMPHLNGFELLGHCQRDPDLSNIPVIILTSRNDEKHRQLASQLGAAAYMTKPYLESKLLNLVKETLEVSLVRSVAGQEVV